MRALRMAPGRAGTVRLDEVDDPVPGDGELLVEGLAVGVCGTDRELVAGDYGWAPPGKDRLVLGHESLGRVLEPSTGSGPRRGDLVVGVVRRPDPEPCGACAAGQFDMCANGRYTERGIKQLDGFASTRWTVEAEYAVRLDPALERVGVLLEPASVVAKAWQQIERIGRRAWFEPRTVLVTGAGPIGLLAALLAAQRGLEVHVLDRVTDGPKPALVRALGAVYHSDDLGDVVEAVRPDVVVEATGAPPVVLGVVDATGPAGIVCLTGISSAGSTLPVDAGAVNRELVLENAVVFGTVNANVEHYALAADALAAADPAWLDGLITRRVPLDAFAEALEPRPDDVKVILDLTA